MTIYVLVQRIPERLPARFSNISSSRTRIREYVHIGLDPAPGHASTPNFFQEIGNEWPLRVIHNENLFLAGVFCAAGNRHAIFYAPPFPQRGRSRAIEQGMTDIREIPKVAFHRC